MTFGSKCTNCGEDLDASSDRCLTCGFDIGAPNVRASCSTSNIAALKARYDDAVFRASARGAAESLRSFEKTLLNSAAVVNCNLSFLKEFVTQSKTLYSGYQQMLQAGVRKVATPERDQERCVVDAIMFRSYSQSIRFAALSLNSFGLASYGPYAMKLRNVAVAHRSSVLEENSFAFVKHHSLGAATAIPAGYRSDWEGRGRLAITKLGDLVDSGPQRGGFSQLLLKSIGDYESDEFMEVHIFGTFDFSAVECVSGPVPKKPAELAVWEAVKDFVRSSGKRIEEC